MFSFFFFVLLSGYFGGRRSGGSPPRALIPRFRKSPEVSASALHVFQAQAFHMTHCFPAFPCLTRVYDLLLIIHLHHSELWASI